MNNETRAKIQFEAEWNARYEAMRDSGATMCDQCGCWDEPFGLMRAVEILPTAPTMGETWCRDCAIETQGYGPDALTECFHCGEWDWESDGETLEASGAWPEWACHYCSVNRGDAIWQSFLEPRGDRPGAAPITAGYRFGGRGEYAPE